MDAPGAMLSGSLRFFNPFKESKAAPRPANVSAGNRFEALKDTHEDDDVEEQSETGDPEQAQVGGGRKLALSGLYSNGRCGCRHAEEKDSNQDICRLHESRKASRRRLGDDCERQMTTMAVLELKRASQQCLFQEPSSEDFQS